jgi:hypothetical protein
LSSLTLFGLILIYSRLSDDATHVLHNAVINFANMIIGNVVIDISTLEREIRYWMGFQFLTPNDKVRESVSVLEKHFKDLRLLATTESDSFPFSKIEVQHHN